MSSRWQFGVPYVNSLDQCISVYAMSANDRLLGASVVLLMICGCATQSIDYGNVSDDLRERTGHEFRAKSDMQSSVIPPGVNLEDGLTEGEAASVALWNNAMFQSIVAKLGFSNAQLIEAGQFTNPTFSNLFPAGPKQLEFAANLPLEALWLRRKRVEVAEIDFRRAAAGLVQNGLDLIRDTSVVSLK